MAEGVAPRPYLDYSTKALTSIKPFAIIRVTFNKGATMSHYTNEQLLDQAVYYADIFEGTALAKALRGDVERNDLETLQVHLSEARERVLAEELGVAQ